MGRFFLYNKNNTKRSNYANNNHFNIYLWLIKQKYNVNIDSAITYWDWKEHYTSFIEVKEYHASVKATWYQYLLGCKWFANKYNAFAKAFNIEYGTCPNRVLLLDYV